jgi:predicted RNA binding protein YcfA (HicA-like mRNA interferase family)
VKPVSGKRMCQVLGRKGWHLIRISGSHHIFGRPDLPTLVVVPSTRTRASPRARNATS